MIVRFGAVIVRFGAVIARFDAVIARFGAGDRCGVHSLAEQRQRRAGTTETRRDYRQTQVNFSANPL